MLYHIRSVKWMKLGEKKLSPGLCFNWNRVASWYPALAVTKVLRPCDAGGAHAPLPPRTVPPPLQQPAAIRDKTWPRSATNHLAPGPHSGNMLSPQFCWHVCLSRTDPADHAVICCEQQTVNRLVTAAAGSKECSTSTSTSSHHYCLFIVCLPATAHLAS